MKFNKYNNTLYNIIGKKLKEIRENKKICVISLKKNKKTIK